MKKDLTKKQETVLGVIKSYINKNNNSPTFKELMGLLKKKKMKLSSLNSLVQYLNKLEEKGYIQKFPGSRGIRLLIEKGGNFLKIPLLGNADCGEPLSFADDIVEDYINVSEKIIKGDKNKYFFVRAVGDSMNKEGIDNGDYVLVKTEPESHSGNNVVAIINGLGTIKKLIKDKGVLMLVPCSTNSTHKPIILHPEDECLICGRVERVFKNSSKVK